MSTNKVYIPNKGYHNFKAAKRFGELVFITEGTVDPYDVNGIFRMVEEALEDSEPEDFLLVNSLSIINAAAAAIFAMKHGRINFLLYSNDKYVVRNIVLGDTQ